MRRACHAESAGACISRGLREGKAAGRGQFGERCATIAGAPAGSTRPISGYLPGSPSRTRLRVLVCHLARNQVVHRSAPLIDSICRRALAINQRGHLAGGNRCFGAYFRAYFAMHFTAHFWSAESDPLNTVDGMSRWFLLVRFRTNKHPTFSWAKCSQHVARHLLRYCVTVQQRQTKENPHAAGCCFWRFASVVKVSPLLA